MAVHLSLYPFAEKIFIIETIQEQQKLYYIN